MTFSDSVNQIVLVVVSGRQAENLMQAFVREGFMFTRIDSSGMVFQDPTITLLVGLNSARTAGLMGLIERLCEPREEYVPVQFHPPGGFSALPMIEARVGGALVYIIDVERFEQI